MSCILDYHAILLSLWLTYYVLLLKIMTRLKKVLCGQLKTTVLKATFNKPPPEYVINLDP